MKLKINSKSFEQDMHNFIEYSIGFLEGVESGKTALYRKLGPIVTNIASDFIDANARMNPQNLHHIYEWYKTGSPDARLFDLEYTITGVGISFTNTFKQSDSIRIGSNVPFYNKAEIMESGTTVTIKPKKADALRFEIDGDIVYTKNPITVMDPGGNTQGQFANIVDLFFGSYFKQSFFRVMGLDKHFENPSIYKTNLNKGKKQGKSAGIKTGFQWVATAGVDL